MTEPSAKPKKGSKQAQLDAIAAQVKGCILCPLWKSRTNAVPGVGNPEAEIVVIGEGPGWHEDQQALPFVGPSGQLLDKMLASIGIKRADVFITNVVKCRPPNNRDPLPNEIATCHPYLQAQLDIIQPRVIVTLGRHSMNLFLPDAKITQVHGQPHRDARSGMMIVPMFHPAAALRTPAWMTALKEDFQKLPALLKELDHQPRPTPPLVTAESPAAEVVAEALQEVSPTAAEAIVAPEVLTEATQPAAEEATAPQPKRTRTSRRDKSESDNVGTQFIAPDADEPINAVETQSNAPRANEPEASAEPKPRRGRKAALSEGDNLEPAAVAAQFIAPDQPVEESPDAAWEELTGAIEARATETRRGRPRKAAATEAEEQPAPNQQTTIAAKPKPTRRQKEEDAGQMSLF